MPLPKTSSVHSVMKMLSEDIIPDPPMAKAFATRMQVLELGPRDGSLLWSGLVWSDLVWSWRCLKRWSLSFYTKCIGKIVEKELIHDFFSSQHRLILILPKIFLWKEWCFSQCGLLIQEQNNAVQGINSPFVLEVNVVFWILLDDPMSF